MDSVIIDLSGAGKEVKDMITGAIDGKVVVEVFRKDLPGGSSTIVIKANGPTNEEMIDVAKMMINLVARTCPFGEAAGIKAVVIHVAEDLLGPNIGMKEGESG